MKNRLVLLIPSKTPGALGGATLETTLTDSSRCGIFHAQANAPGPPPEIPTIANFSIPRASASSVASSAQSRRERPGFGSDRPYPGRSGATSRSPGGNGLPGRRPQERRDPGNPWNRKTGAPSDSPYSAYANRLLSDKRMALSIRGGAMSPASYHVNRLLKIGNFRVSASGHQRLL